MVLKGLERVREKLLIGGQIETIQTIALLRSTRLLRRVLETWRGSLSLSLHKKRPTANANGKKSQGVKS